MADRLLTIPEVAAQLGIGRATVYRRIAAGWFDRVDVGDKASKTRIPQSSVDQVIKSRTIPRKRAA